MAFNALDPVRCVWGVLCGISPVQHSLCGWFERRRVRAMTCYDMRVCQHCAVLVADVAYAWRCAGRLQPLSVTVSGSSKVAGSDTSRQRRCAPFTCPYCCASQSVKYRPQLRPEEEEGKEETVFILRIEWIAWGSIDLSCCCWGVYRALRLPKPRWRRQTRWWPTPTKSSILPMRTRARHLRHRWRRSLKNSRQLLRCDLSGLVHAAAMCLL